MQSSCDAPSKNRFSRDASNPVLNVVGVIRSFRSLVSEALRGWLMQSVFGLVAAQSPQLIQRRRGGGVGRAVMHARNCAGDRDEVGALHLIRSHAQGLRIFVWEARGRGAIREMPPCERLAAWPDSALARRCRHMAQASVACVARGSLVRPGPTTRFFRKSQGLPCGVSSSEFGSVEWQAIGKLWRLLTATFFASLVA